MNRTRVFKKFLVPGGLVSAAVITDGGANAGNEGGKLVRPSELPIYAKECPSCHPQQGLSDEPSSLETQIGVIRKEMWIWHDKYKEVKREVVDVCQTGLAHTEASLEYLKEESNYLPRYGAIAIGGVAGAVLGLRGGMIRRLVYGTGGALGVAALCYPAHAAEAAHEVSREAKRATRIVYNFVYGVKPDYLKLPDPASFLQESGADMKKPAAKSAGDGRSLLDTVKESFLELTGQKGGDKATTTAPVEGTSRDQSHPDDKSLYTTRQ